MGISPRCGSRKAAPIALDRGWTEVSLSPGSGHCGSAATPIFAACTYRSVLKQAVGMYRVTLVRLSAGLVRPAVLERLGGAPLSLSTI
ncbi:MAG: hypothetical protein ACI4WS_08015 [Oscillospiraceae bacterium]